jgi:hypothetical protein
VAESNEQVAETRPFMPVEMLVEEAAPESDYADGDNPGWFSGQWNPDSRELVLKYQADDDCEPEYLQYRSTEHVFRLGAQARVGGPSLGETAYSGYFVACGGKSLISGAELPSWDEQAPEIRTAWESAADAVRRAC